MAQRKRPDTTVFLVHVDTEKRSALVKIRTATWSGNAYSLGGASVFDPKWVEQHSTVPGAIRAEMGWVEVGLRESEKKLWEATERYERLILRLHRTATPAATEQERDDNRQILMDAKGTVERAQKWVRDETATHSLLVAMLGEKKES